RQCACSGSPLEHNPFDRRLAVLTHEVVLEIEHAGGGAHASPHSVVAHRQYLGHDPKSVTKICGDCRQTLTCPQSPRAFDMGREIAVAELEPHFAAELAHCVHEIPRLVAAAPARIRIVEPR